MNDAPSAVMQIARVESTVEMKYPSATADGLTGVIARSFAAPFTLSEIMRRFEQNATRYTAYRKQRRHKLTADGRVYKLFGNLKRRRERGGKAVAVDIPEEGYVQNEKYQRSYQGGEKHSLILEKQIAVASYESAESCHFSVPWPSFFPVTARNTSSIFPFVISKSPKSPGFSIISFVALAVSGTEIRKASPILS